MHYATIHFAYCSVYELFELVHRFRHLKTAEVNYLGIVKLWVGPPEKDDQIGTGPPLLPYLQAEETHSLHLKYPFKTQSLEKL